MSTLGVDTPLWQAMAYMVLMGAGLGLSMQTLVISVQNALPPRDMGVATGSVTFFRSMGGTFGAAVSLAVLFGSLAGNIQDARPRRRPAGRRSWTASRSASALDDTSVIATLPGRRCGAPCWRASPTRCRRCSSSVAVLLVPAFVLTLFVKEIPLRAQGGIAAAHADAQTEERLSASRAESAVL